MPTEIDVLRQRVLRASGNYAPSAASTALRGPRPIYMVVREMQGIWFTKGTDRRWTTEKDTLIWPTVDGKRASPPVKSFGGACTTQIVLQQKMVNRVLWDEAQVALRWLLARVPGAQATPRQKAEWVVLVYSWAGVAMLASDLNTAFWFIPQTATVPQCSPGACNEAQRAFLDCCPARDQQLAYMYEKITNGKPAGSTVDYIRAATEGYSSAPDPRLFLYETQNGVRSQSGCNMPERGCQVSGLLTPLPPAASRTDKFWLKYEVGPYWPCGPEPGCWGDVAWQPDGAIGTPGSIPDAVLAQIDAEAPRSVSKAERAHAAFVALPMVDQLERIFSVLSGSTNVVAPTIRGWTIATPAGLLEQAKRTAAFWAGMNLDFALGQAMLFYSANHLQYFAARGEIGLSAGEIENAYRVIQAQGSAQLGAMLAGGAALLSATGGPAGMVAGLILGVFAIWESATGEFPLPFNYSFIKEIRIPQPLFMRVMPQCEEFARAMAATEGLPLGNYTPPRPGPSLLLVVGGGVLGGAFLGWLLGR